MTTLDQHQASKFVKMILLGDPGTGKTGALASLVKAGYKLRILDYDNNLDPLAQFVRREAPDKLKNIEFRTLTDKMKAGVQGQVPDGVPTAYSNGIKMLDNWKYKEGEIEIDLGKPSQFGLDTILVLDSLTFFSKASFRYWEALNPGVKDPRQIYKMAQDAVEDTLSQFKYDGMQTNIIVTAHVMYDQYQDGTTKGFPKSIGSALSPTIPAYFTSIALMEKTGAGDKVQRTIRTVPTALIDLRNPAPFAMAAALPISTGLADFFKTVRG